MTVDRPGTGERKAAGGVPQPSAVLTVLVIDGRFASRMGVANLLRDCREVKTVLTAPDVEAGRRAISDRSIDLLLLEESSALLSPRQSVHQLLTAAQDSKVVILRPTLERGGESARELGLGSRLPLVSYSGRLDQAGAEYLRAALAPIVRMLHTRRLAMSAAACSEQMRRRSAEQGDRPPRRIQPKICRAGVDSPLPRLRFGVLAIGISTGGPQALVDVIPNLPGDLPVPVLVVQHMPPMFTTALAADLDRRSELTVVEATDGMRVEEGVVYIAPGGKHMVVRGTASGVTTGLNEEPPENGVRPSVDVLFRSVAQCYRKVPVLAVIMTGMGVDGRNGVEALKQNQCYCVSQSPETCIVYGMPMAVDEAGLSDESVTLNDLAPRITRLIKG